MCACTEHHILTPESGQFAVSQTRLDRYKKQRSVAVADPRSYIGCRYQSCGLALGEKLDGTVFAAFGWNCKNALALQEQSRLTDRNEPEEGMHSGKARVA